MNTVKFYRVGGCVRDSLMGFWSNDIDYSVEANSFDEMRAAVIERCGGNPDCIKVEKAEFVTIRAVHPVEGGLDFVLCRKDGAYSDGRRPDSVEIGTLLDDLSRRDFTCNAIAQDDEGNLIDPFGGQMDIQLNVLNCVGSVNRLREDSLRMIRALRFHITKNFALSPEIKEFLYDEENAKLLHNISQERIREELNKCFAHNTLRTINMLDRFNEIKNAILASGKLSLEATMKKR